jgi:hypothetical protein
MTVFRITTIHRYVGLDADEKPLEGVPVGSRFLEADDAVEFINIGAYYAEGLLEMADAGEVDDAIAIGDTTYTIIAAPEDPAVPEAGDVAIGATAALTAAAIVAAINGTDGHNDPDPAVRAELVGVDVRVIALEPGADGNTIATVYTEDDASANAFADETLLGAYDAWQALP